MTYDVVIRGGTIVDGSGLAPFRADVGVVGERIVRVGRIREHGDRELDADGLVVSPGFIDGHTHMDAQMFWDPLGASSCWHGVTTVVTGNCGYTIAPCRAEDAGLVLGNLEKAEDIPRSVLEAGIPDWSWSSFRSYLDVLDALPKGINYAANLGHSALRTWAMGERAFSEEASEDELELMARELRDAMLAGAIGFTTSRDSKHLAGGDRPVASRQAAWSEVERLVGVLADLGTGIFELAPETAMMAPDLEAKAEWMERLGALAVTTGVPTTFGVFSMAGDPRSWRDVLAFIDRTNDRGGRMFGEVHCREISHLPSFQTSLPFDKLPAWAKVRRLALGDQRAALADPTVRRRLAAAVDESPDPVDFDAIEVLVSPTPGNPSLATVARERGVSPVEAMLDLALQSDFEQFFRKVVVNHDLEEVFTMMRHPHTVMTFSDSGAHVAHIMDASIHTSLLAYWVRERQAISLPDAIRMITLAPARAWSFSDRGLLREGMVADVNVFDPNTIGPRLPKVVRDLPAGSPHIVQESQGIHATLVGGQPTIIDGKHTAALPGRLLRGPSAVRPRGL